MERHTTLDHPLFARLIGPPPDRGLLRATALQGYQLTKAFLGYVEALFFHCPLPKHKRRLLVNLFEEETGHFSRTDNHLRLMQRFLSGLGIGDAERDAAAPYPETLELIEYRRALVADPATYHLGAAAVLIASEGQNLETLGGEARDGAMARAFGLSEDDLCFFRVHQEEDVGHVHQGLDLVVELCTDEERRAGAVAAVERTCALFRGMYDGIERQHPA
ncbi:MAG: iron-containing redox enzyme family protein [Planctomycetota bacterium]